MLALETADSITRFAATEWDALLAPTDYFKHGYLAALEASGLDCHFHYATLHAGGKLVGLGFGCVMRFNFGLWHPKIWLGGSPVNLGEPFAFAPGYDTPAARHRLQEALFAKARQARALYFVLRDFLLSGPDDPGASFAPALRLSPLPLHRTAILPLEFTDFDDYLSSLKGSRRKSARRDIRAVETTGFRLSIERPAPALAPRLLELWLNLYNKYRDPDQIRLTEDYFRALAGRPEAVFLLLWRGDRLVAFDLCLRFGELLSSVFSGLDFEATREQPVHRYMGYAIVRHAIASGYRKIDFGISNEAAKERMGCRLELLYGQARLVPALLHGLRADRLVRALFAAPVTSAARENGRSEKNGEEGRPPEAPTVLRGWRRVVVVGAGLSGLAAAARLASQPHRELVVLEQAAEPGGMCRTVSYGHGREGFIAGCNLFSPRFFALLEHACRIRLPTRRARLLTYYDGQPLDTRTLVGHLASSQELVALGRLTSGWLHNAQALSERVTRPSLTGDLALLPFLLQGQAPWHWPVREGLVKLRAIASNRYPVPGLAAIPQALERVITRGPSARLVYQAPARSIVVHRGRVIGVRTPEAEWPADIVLSSLMPHTTRKLLGGDVLDTSAEGERPAGLSAMAVFLMLDAGFTLPEGCYSLGFVEPDILGQLRELFAGRVPDRPGFELICPDLAEGRPSTNGWRMTLFTTCPAHCTTAQAERLWSRMAERLEQSFPGFMRAIHWSQLVPPDEYEQAVGCSSRLSPYADAPPRTGKALPPWADGLFLAYGRAAAGDTLLAVRAGLACANQVLASVGLPRLRGQ
ncbi:GNAT family N-acetyltransferase [Archangium sp.]|uniref:GNAT family N-acetyltransferase n=1 Tax=Archangium sp. TaxID=1872627 RepID=UPI002D4D676C|nr:GNAT family N-acetyltransferase [Archangium sp.]HYO52462.1 GNAT family N-acetyltransferase [Archangium sp.]